MFGYVLPRKDKLSPEAAVRYKAGYCGLCHTLKQRYGFRARFLVNYDMTFLYFLLQEEKQDANPCPCPARPFCKKACLTDDPVMDYAADMSILLMYWKLRDALQDGGFFRRIGARLALAFYRRCYTQARDRHPETDAFFARQLDRLQHLEAECCPSLDRPADAFAALLRGCAAFEPDEKLRRMLELLLYHVGRFLYLVDALEDLPKDAHKGTYNPLLYRFHPVEGKLTDEDRALLTDSLEASISLAASALELLPPRADQEIVHNIIYYGLPAVLYAVADGSFRKPNKRSNG